MPRKKFAVSITTIVALLGLAGCGGLQLKLNNQSVQKPSNVALYFSVEEKNGNPVGGLTAETFRIFEDDQLISPYESKQTILNPEETVVHYTLLLVDLSGSITESGSLPTLISAASGFGDRVTKYHQVGSYGFAGGPRLIPLVGFTNQGGAIRQALAHLETYKAKDPSTNFNGAVAEALNLLIKQMESSTKSLRFATLVIFTDGKDRAHRVSEQDMYEALDQAFILNVFTIGLGPEISDAELSKIGRSGFVRAADQSNVQSAFDEVATRIENAARKYYLLSYCSPSRAGKHRLRVEANFNGQSGSLEHEFDATGFGPNCDSNRRPNFPVGKIQAK